MLEKFVYKVGMKLVNNPAMLVELAPMLIVVGAACAVADLVNQSK